jgi:hypothetical protein
MPQLTSRNSTPRSMESFHTDELFKQCHAQEPSDLLPLALHFTGCHNWDHHSSCGNCLLHVEEELQIQDGGTDNCPLNQCYICSLSSSSSAGLQQDNCPGHSYTSIEKISIYDISFILLSSTSFEPPHPIQWVIYRIIILGFIIKICLYATLSTFHKVAFPSKALGLPPI